MKILYLITKSEFGGAQTHVADLCRYFHEQGHQVIVMSRAGGWLEEACKDMGVTFVDNIFFSNSANPFTLYCAIRNIQTYVRQFQPDIVHCHSSAAAFLGRIAIRGRIRTIYTAHGWGFNIGMKPWIMYPVLCVEKFCARYTDTYICVADFVRQLGLRYRLAPEHKFRVVHNGVKIQEPHVSKTLSSAVNILFAGRLAEPKKPELLLHAIGLLTVEIQKKIVCTIVGGGPKKKKLEVLAHNMGIPIEFTGPLPHPEVVRQMVQADIFVFLSAWEGLPYTVLEAMSCGLPVIASDVGGVREMVDEQNGSLVENTVTHVRDALLHMVQDSGSRTRMGRLGRAKIEQAFSLEGMYKKVEIIYALKHM